MGQSALPHREVPLIPAARALLKKFHAACQNAASVAIDGVPHVDPKSKVLAVSEARKSLARTCEKLGIEPLTRAFTPAYLRRALQGKTVAIKPALMDASLVVGVGNIYAAESLFDAGIDPRTPAGRISLGRLSLLVPAIKKTLQAAIRAGGSTLRDFSNAQGESGHFQLEAMVYARQGEPCRQCGTAIKSIKQGQRSTFFCPQCQKP